jgi:hypothetical protein
MLKLHKLTLALQKLNFEPQTRAQLDLCIELLCEPGILAVLQQKSSLTKAISPNPDYHKYESKQHINKHNAYHHTYNCIEYSNHLLYIKQLSSSTTELHDIIIPPLPTTANILETRTDSKAAQKRRKKKATAAAANKHTTPPLPTLPTPLVTPSESRHRTKPASSKARRQRAQATQRNNPRTTNTCNTPINTTTSTTDTSANQKCRRKNAARRQSIHRRMKVKVLA